MWGRTSGARPLAAGVWMAVAATAAASAIWGTTGRLLSTADRALDKAAAGAAPTAADRARVRIEAVRGPGWRPGQEQGRLWR